MGTGARARARPVVALRAARDSDVDAMLAIERASFSDPWSRYALQTSVSSPALAVIVAEIGATPDLVGYSVVARVADEAELLNLAVVAHARGQGIGAALVQRALADARAWGARAVFLEVRDSNDAARALYGKAGFLQVGRRRGYYRRPSEDALILRKQLSD